MARSTPGVTRQRIVDEATTLFARDGYEATTTGDVQRACGLNPGSGALYKHFSSKRALLEEIVEQHLAAVHDSSRRSMRLPEEPGQALPMIARLIWDSMRRDRDPLRIIFRELDRFPDLLDKMWRGVLREVYTTATEWVRAGVERGRFRAADPESTAAVLLASLTYYPILDALVGHTPGDVGEDAFLDAWTRHALATLGVADARA